MKNIYLLLLIFLAGMAQMSCSDSDSRSVNLAYDSSSRQANYAAEKLRGALEQRGYEVTEGRRGRVITLMSDAGELRSEAYSMTVDGGNIVVAGGDERGMIYGALGLAEDLANGMALEDIQFRSESPHYPFRAIKFDLPWDTYRQSYALDLHYETCRDLAYWEKFLDMMVKNRFNSLTIWNLHPYTYMIKPTNYPEASPFSDAEMKEWQELFQGIFRMASERAIETYIFPFNIFVSPAFAKAHNVAMDNLNHHFFVKGDTSEIIKQYTRECVSQVLQEYPELTGIGLTLGEGMGGMTPVEREDWIRETIIEGMKMSGRKAKLVHRIPLSANTGSGGSTSVDVEQMTREVLEEEGKLDFLIPPIWADLKYNWSHAHSTPKLVKVHGGKLHDTYFKPEPQNYKVTWTARNEDFFCLRWGVPEFVREHVAENSQSFIGGYFVGSETYIPAVDYFTKVSDAVNWQYAFERQWLFYKVWGRLLYNPETPDAVFAAEFTRRYGERGKNLLQAYALSGTTPLYLASYFDFTWDFTLYSEGFLAKDNESGNVEYITVDRQINQSPTDPKYLSIKEYVSAVASGVIVNSDMITPLALADSLYKDATGALDLVKGINTSDDASLRYEVADIQVWANLGLYFAEKLRGAVALHTYRTAGGEDNKQRAVEHLEASLGYWDQVVDITEPIYKDMPLVHYSEQKGNTEEQNNNLRFHWRILRPEVANDLEMAKNARAFSAK